MSQFDNSIPSSLQDHIIHGEDSIPIDYPKPKHYSDLLFYIQRNHNKNTIVYELNRNQDHTINEYEPIKMYWIRYDDKGERKKLNYLQKKLVYGYDAKQINRDTYEIRFVAHPKLRFYLAKEAISKIYHVFIRLDEKLVSINNMYAFADHYGAFPYLKSIEIIGKYVHSNEMAYTKLSF